MSSYVDESGSKDAPTIVFQHDGSVRGWMWQAQVAQVADYHFVYRNGEGLDQR